MSEKVSLIQTMPTNVSSENQSKIIETTTSNSNIISSSNKHNSNIKQAKKNARKVSSSTTTTTTTTPFVVVNMAPKFKHPSNCSRKEVQTIRKLMLAEFEQLDLHQRQAKQQEMERLLKDDWLISRFLFKGYKEAKQQEKLCNFSSKQRITRSNNDSSDDDDDDENDENKLDQSNDCDERVIRKTIELMKRTDEFRREYCLTYSLSDADFPSEWVGAGGMLSGLPDLNGNATVYMRLCLYKPKQLTNAKLKYEFKRFMLYVMDKSERTLVNKEGAAVVYIFDFKDVSYENYDLETITWLVSIQKTVGPKMQAYTMIYNLPWIFNVPFKIISTAVITGSNRNRLEFVTGAEILNYISAENLPQYLKEKLL